MSSFSRPSLSIPDVSGTVLSVGLPRFGSDTQSLFKGNTVDLKCKKISFRSQLHMFSVSEMQVYTCVDS